VALVLLALPTFLYPALFPSAVWLVLKSGPTAQAAFTAGCMLAVVAAGLTAGGWYYRLRQCEATGVVYEWLGVRLFRRFVVEGDYFNRFGRRTGFDPAPAWSAGAARAAERRGRLSERVHAVALALLVPSAAGLLLEGRLAAGGGVLLGTVVLDLYPVMLQRYTRSRLGRIAERLAWRERNAPRRLAAPRTSLE
jgi:predicted RNA-binding Zn ribbon-like protein